MPAAPPTVIEIALNGMTTKEQNPFVPRTVDEIVEDGLRCLDAGASVVHHHNDEPNFGVLTWMAAVFGGDVVASGIAALAIERGGHVRVGLEDHHAPPRQPTNQQLVAEIVDLCRAAGRRPATVEEAPKLLFG